MLLDAASKILSSILSERLQDLLREEGLEEQCGFTVKRGCSDGSFILRMALQKRHEHNQDSWAVFVDLVKAFDTVDRDGMVAVLKKLGVSNHFCEIITRLHTGCQVKLKVGDSDIQFDSTIGVKQGDNLAPILFLVVMQAVIETLEPIWPAEKLDFRTKEHGCCQGQNWTTKGRIFKFWASLYADDTAIVFRSRAELEMCMPVLDAHLKRFGMLMHVKSAGGKKEAKTECMFFPRPGLAYESGDTSPVLVNDKGDTISFCKSFKYLGSRIHWDLCDDDDVLSRLKAATGAFGSLRDSVFNSKFIRPYTKKIVYLTIVVNLLLYGSESWCLTEKLLHRLNCFHNRCIRSMCRVTKRQTWLHKIDSDTLRRRLKLEKMEYYISLRKLRWAGHLARMPMTRLPRQFLTSWVNHPRPHGRPQYTYGHSLNKSLKRAGIPSAFKEWSQLAQDRSNWRKLFYAKAEFPPSRQS